MNTPHYLKKNDKVAITSPAGKADIKVVEKAKLLLEKEGYEVLLGKNIGNDYFRFSAKDEERAQDLQFFLDHPEVKAIFCTRGGYGSIRTIQKIDFSGFQKNPKWLIGFSDITVFHSYLNTKLNIPSIHGAMPINFVSSTSHPDSFNKLLDALKGEHLNYSEPGNTYNVEGFAEGKIVGGNLSILCSLQGTPYEIKTENQILFIEEVGEYLYSIDRMMHNLKLSNKLKKIKALIIGGITNVKEDQNSFGQKIEEIVLNCLENKNIPICFDFSSGHISRNLPLILNKSARLKVCKKNVELVQ